VVKLLRAILDAVAPGVLLITETNVPHEENVRYFGDPLPGIGGTDEAQMVYQFPLAPLVMHSILAGDARTISQWAAGPETPSPEATFFNFTASHDGIGVMPARGLLSETGIQALVDTTLAHGGHVSQKANADGSQSVYQLNISYFDALSDPAAIPFGSRSAHHCRGERNTRLDAVCQAGAGPDSGAEGEGVHLGGSSRWCGQAPNRNALPPAESQQFHHCGGQPGHG